MATRLEEDDKIVALPDRQLPVHPNTMGADNLYVSAAPHPKIRRADSAPVDDSKSRKKTKKDPPPPSPKMRPGWSKPDTDLANFMEARRKASLLLAERDYQGQQVGLARAEQLQTTALEHLKVLRRASPTSYTGSSDTPQAYDPSSFTWVMGQSRSGIIQQRVIDMLTGAVAGGAAARAAGPAATQFTEAVIGLAAAVPGQLVEVVSGIYNNWHTVPGKAVPAVLKAISEIINDAKNHYSDQKRAVAFITLAAATRIGWRVARDQVKHWASVAWNVPWVDVFKEWKDKAAEEKQKDVAAREEETEKGVKQVLGIIRQNGRLGDSTRDLLASKWRNAHLLRNVREQIELVESINKRGCADTLEILFKIVSKYADSDIAEYLGETVPGELLSAAAQTIGDLGPFVMMRIRYAQARGGRAVENLTADDMEHQVQYKKHVDFARAWEAKARAGERSNAQCGVGQILAILMYLMVEGWAHEANTQTGLYKELNQDGSQAQIDALSRILQNFLEGQAGADVATLVDFKKFSCQVVKALLIETLDGAGELMEEWNRDWWHGIDEQWWEGEDTELINDRCNGLAAFIIGRVQIKAEKPGAMDAEPPASPREAATLPEEWEKPEGWREGEGGGKRRKKSKRKPRKTIRRKTIRRKSTKRKTNKRKSKRNLRKTNVRKKSRKLSRK